MVVAPLAFQGVEGAYATWLDPIVAARGDERLANAETYCEAERPRAIEYFRTENPGVALPERFEQAAYMESCQKGVAYSVRVEGDLPYILTNAFKGVAVFLGFAALASANYNHPRRREEDPAGPEPSPA